MSKKKPERAGHNINVILDDDLVTALEKAVVKTGESLSTVVRMSLRKTLREAGFLK